MEGGVLGELVHLVDKDVGVGPGGDVAPAVAGELADLEGQLAVRGVGVELVQGEPIGGGRGARVAVVLVVVPQVGCGKRGK